MSNLGMAAFALQFFSLAQKVDLEIERLSLKLHKGEMVPFGRENKSLFGIDVTDNLSECI